LSADLLSDHKHAQRNNVEISKSPDLFLELYTLLELGNTGAFANEEMIRRAGHFIH
jgi:hypothetical protein